LIAVLAQKPQRIADGAWCVIVLPVCHKRSIHLLSIDEF
jgi:hypothetical protein